LTKRKKKMGKYTAGGGHGKKWAREKKKGKMNSIDKGGSKVHTAGESKPHDREGRVKNGKTCAFLRGGGKKVKRVSAGKHGDGSNGKPEMSLCSSTSYGSKEKSKVAHKHCRRNLSCAAVTSPTGKAEKGRAGMAAGRTERGKETKEKIQGDKKSLRGYRWWKIN